MDLILYLSMVGFGGFCTMEIMAETILGDSMDNNKIIIDLFLSVQYLIPASHIYSIKNRKILKYHTYPAMLNKNFSNIISHLDFIE